MIDNLWDLFRVGERAAARHKRKLYDRLKESATDLLLSEDVVTSDGAKKVRVKIRVLEIPRFLYDYHDETQTGIGKEPKPGDVLWEEQEEEGEGAGSGAGNGGGSTYEVEMSMDELIEMLIEQWELPNLDEKRKNEIVSEDYTMTDISTKGPMSRVHRKRTVKNAIKRAVATGDELLIHNDDLRFKSPKTTFTYTSNAVIVLLRDRSGSMGPFEMKVSRITSMWLVQFLRRRYDKVAIRFVLHDYDASEVDEDTFYHVTSGGGTSIANGYRFVDKVLDEYPRSMWNRYVVHFSDGDDWSTKDSIGEMRNLLGKTEAVAYFEVDQTGSHVSEFWHDLEAVEQDYKNFIRSEITREEDVQEALRTFLSADVA